MSDAIGRRDLALRQGWLTVSLLIAGLVEAPPVLAQATGSAPEHRFANEPWRPKAGSPVRFSSSWDEARAEARRTGRRLLVYFTGKNCGWCRVLEKRCFTDAEVVDFLRPSFRADNTTSVTRQEAVN